MWAGAAQEPDHRSRMSFLVPDYINRDLPLTNHQRKAIRKESWKLWMKDWRNVLGYLAVIAVMLGGGVVLGWFMGQFGPTGRHVPAYPVPVHRTRVVRQLRFAPLVRRVIQQRELITDPG